MATPIGSPNELIIWTQNLPRSIVSFDAQPFISLLRHIWRFAMNKEAWSAQYVTFAVAQCWGFVWKGISLWRSGMKKQPVWFFSILITNTLGILEIIYLLFFQRKKD
jgi:hypothetical protein